MGVVGPWMSTAGGAPFRDSCASRPAARSDPEAGPRARLIRGIGRIVRPLVRVVSGAVVTLRGAVEREIEVSPGEATRVGRRAVRHEAKTHAALVAPSDLEQSAEHTLAGEVQAA